MGQHLLQNTLTLEAPVAKQQPGPAGHPGGDPARVTSRDRSVIPLEGARGAASLGVLLIHVTGLLSSLCMPAAFAHALGFMVGVVGSIGTDLFFLLAGFVSYGVLITGRKSWGDWLFGRLSRLYPQFLIIELVYVAICLLAPGVSKLPAEFSACAWYLGANFLMLSGLLGVPSLSIVTWTLSYNLLLYALLPPVLTGLRLQQWGAHFRLGFLLLLFCVGGILLAHSPHSRAWAIVAGLCVREIHNQYGSRVQALRKKEGWVIAGVVLTIALLCKKAASGNAPAMLGGEAAWQVWRLFLVSGALGMICLFCSEPGTYLGWLASTRPARWLGKRSYACFLTHSLSLHLVVGLLRLGLDGQLLSTVGWGAALVVAVCASLLVANGFYFMTELITDKRSFYWRRTQSINIRTEPGFAIQTQEAA